MKNTEYKSHFERYTHMPVTREIRGEKGERVARGKCTPEGYGKFDIRRS